MLLVVSSTFCFSVVVSTKFVVALVEGGNGLLLGMGWMTVPLVVKLLLVGYTIVARGLLVVDDTVLFTLTIIVGVLGVVLVVTGTGVLSLDDV